MSLFKIHLLRILLLIVLASLTSCAQSPPPIKIKSSGTDRAFPSPSITTIPSLPSLKPSSTKMNRTQPTRYLSHRLVQGQLRPDDLAFDQQGRLLFSDEFAGTINRRNIDGSLTTLLVDHAGPEGLVGRPDGTLLFAEQDTNRIMSLAPGSSSPTLLRVLPGISRALSCKHGVDGIAFDPTTNTLIIPDSPTGVIYRMSLDGKTLTALSPHIVRPVGAGVDTLGNLYIADECGNAVWRITPAGITTRFGGFGMPDDVIPDGYGNLLVIDLDPSIHALIRLNLTTGQHEMLASQGFIEPQGLVVDHQGDIYVADDYANLIEEFTPVFT